MVRGRVHHGRTPTRFVPALSFTIIPETGFLRPESSLKFREGEEFGGGEAFMEREPGVPPLSHLPKALNSVFCPRFRALRTIVWTETIRCHPTAADPLPTSLVLVRGLQGTQTTPRASTRPSTPSKLTHQRSRRSYGRSLRFNPPQTTLWNPPLRPH